jgi:Reverse transcriptase (RNA-dependent DNA polymerase)
MRLRSSATLNLDQAWARARASANTSGIPDRLPFEVLTRLRNSGHGAAVGSFSSPYSPGTPVVVFAPKESRTLRPFVALPPQDHVLFQGLVDQCLPTMVDNLPPDDVVFQYRPQTTGRATFADHPRWTDFTGKTRAHLSTAGGYLLEADIAGFFLHIRPSRIITGLLALGAPADACADLGVLLAHFELHGVQGLPQGQDASSALSNVALRPLDTMLSDAGITYSRWSDDLRVFTPTYTEARVVQEKIERHLFEEGFTLAAGKTTVRTAKTAIQRLEDLEASLARIRDDRIREAMADMGPYDPEDSDLEAAQEEAQVGAVEEFYDEIIGPIRAGGWSRDPLFRTKLSFALRMLGQVGSASATADVGILAFRYPAELEPITNYLRRIASNSRVEVVAALRAMHGRRSYAGEYRRLAVASAAVALAPDGPEPDLAALFMANAADDAASPILRRRAGLAAVALSPRVDTSAATALWERFDGLPDPTLSKLYLIIGASILARAARDQLFSLWTGESRLLTALIETIRGGTVYDMARV